jgi:signal transduction histidine kinase/CheY-like chemotaxis protein
MEPTEILKRKLKREIAARLEAERLLEERSRELFAKGQNVERLNSTLEDRVAAGTVQLQRSNAMLTILHETVLMAAEVETFDEALERCLKAICEFSGWPLGHIYKRSTGLNDRLASSGIWFFERPESFKRFREISELTKFEKGVGLPGRIWKSGAPAWIDDIRQDGNCPRTKANADLNVRCGFGFPVKIKGRVAAVLEFFNDELFERDDQLLILLGSVGEQVGRVLERQEAHREQRAAREDAERANQAKSRFLANMSHEIRTPMNAILGLTELVRDSEVSSLQHEYLSTVLASGESLLALVNDILDLSKIEADAVNLEKIDLNLYQLVFSVMRAMATQAHVKELELLCSMSADVPEFICGDETRIQQILVNLIGNAIKFTPQGEVELFIELVTPPSGERELKFLVRDTGIGIPKEKQDLIFSEFEQADASTTRQFGGTGLGLSIVSRLVGLMCGNVVIESVVGSGSEIGFSINESYYRTKVGRDQLIAGGLESPFHWNADAAEASLAGCCVMLIDSNLRHQRVFAEWITRFGGTVCLSNALSDVSDRLNESELSSKNVHFVFVDSRLVDRGDVESAQELLSQFPDTTRFMLMLDSMTHWHDAVESGAMEFCRQFRRPLNYPEVLTQLYELQNTGNMGGASIGKIPEVDPSTPRSLKILVAEDSLVNQKLAIAMLTKLGHEVVIAGHGKEALAAIEVNEFDLVLMDIQMPEMDGFETVKRLREAEVDSRLPVIALTANAMRGDRDACLEAGMDAYISKPIRLQKLADVINEVCHVE